jgi:ribulose-phosphate 3-epimerase
VSNFLFDLLSMTLAPCVADAVSLINAIHARNMKAGVAISPDTPSTAITDEIGAAADMLLVMTVYPGTS